MTGRGRTRGRNAQQQVVQGIGEVRGRIANLEATLAEAQARAAAAEAEAAALREAQQNQPAPAARIPNIRTHLPDKFEGRSDDWALFIDDVRSYCQLTNVPDELQVSYAFRCLGKAPKRVWTNKLKAWKAANAGVEANLDVFDQLMSSVYDTQDRATKARNKLDTVYQGTEPLHKYVERITTLFGEVETHEPIAMGEKLHRFKKGLREDLQEKCVIDPHTGSPYEDIDVLIAALTKYEAAMGAGQRQPKQRRMNGQLAATGTPPGQRTRDNGQWTGEATPHTLMQLPAQLNALQPSHPRRDGLPPAQRQDFRSNPGVESTCHFCKVFGHEQWQCPVKKWAKGQRLTDTDLGNIEMLKPHMMRNGTIFPEFGSLAPPMAMPPALPMPPAFPMPPVLPMPPGMAGGAQWGGRGSFGGRGRGGRQGSGYRKGHRRGGRAT